MGVRWQESPRVSKVDDDDAGRTNGVNYTILLFLQLRQPTDPFPSVTECSYAFQLVWAGKGGQEEVPCGRNRKRARGMKNPNSQTVYGGHGSLSGGNLHDVGML